MADIFINYRRKDAAWAAGRVGDRLRIKFGDEAVFLDTITIEPGVDFVEAIGDHVEDCRVLLSLIGPIWGDELRLRLSQANDFVRIEIAQALKRGIRVIPIIIDDSSIPTARELPEDLESLSRLNAVRIEADSFDSDMSNLVGFLESFLARKNEVDESEKPSAASTSFAQEKQIEVNLTHRTEFWKNGQDGRPRHRIFVSLNAPADTLSRVSKVTYRLHPTFKNPVREIIDPRNNFELRTNGWGEFEIGADVYFTDRTQPVRLKHRVTFN